MEEFIKTYAERLQNYKKNVFTLKNSTEFLLKLCERGDIQKMESELSKCLITNYNGKDLDERKTFISNFVENYKKFSDENKLIRLEVEDNKKETKIDKSAVWSGQVQYTNPQSVAKSKNLKDDFTLQPKFKVKNKEEEFPTLENFELIQRKKNYEVLTHHYANKIEKGVKICFCMSMRHPLVGNCTNCGRIQCLQEGDKECIVCGTEIIKKDEYMKMCTEDKDMKKAFTHKEKLLKFQADFYSKLQIIDDFTDWYEIANNTWINKEQREVAKKRDEDLDKRRDDQEFSYNINFKTCEIEQVYNTVNESQVREEVTNFLMNDIRKNKEKGERQLTNSLIMKNLNTTSNSSSYTPNATMNCRNQFQETLENYNQLIKKNYQENIKSLSKKIELNGNDKIGDELALYTKNLLHNIELSEENDNFPINSDDGMCLSMHQPWASLLIEGFKRFEGRDWDTEYRGILWIHATSKKPEEELIDAIEAECVELYKNCQNMPQFPKKYPVSALLGCVDLVDCVKKETYQKLIPHEFREKAESSHLFVCKNPKKLEIPHKMPGQPKLYKLDKDIVERSHEKLIKVNTFWWPTPGLKVNLIDIPFNQILKPESKILQSKSKSNLQPKLKIINNVFSSDKVATNSFILIQNFITRERKENLLSFIESFKKEMTLHYNYIDVPYIHYGLTKKLIPDENLPIIFSDLIKELILFFRDEKKIKINLNLKDITVEYIDWYGIQNFRENQDKSIKLFIGNPLIMSILNDVTDLEGKSIKLECGDIFYISNKYLYSISQVLYDTTYTKYTKLKQGTIVISFNFN